MLKQEFLLPRDDCMDAGGRAMHGAITEKARMGGYESGRGLFIRPPLPNPDVEGR
jgi:hypothetical protein